MKKYIKTDVAILGAGPGGYTAAFRCSDLGFKTILIDKNINLGGVCLNYGCIPSKSLLYFAKIINDTNKFYDYGILKNKIDLFDIKNLNTWKNRIISQLSKGLNKLSNFRNIEIIHGFGYFINKNLLEIKNTNILIEFEYAIIATGSEPNKINFIDYNNKNIWDSKKALEIPFIPNKLLIIGGGIIGMEMATIYKYFGSNIDIIEIGARILPDLDNDLVETFKNININNFNIYENISIKSIENIDNIVKVSFNNNINNVNYINEYDSVIISIGRHSNVKDIGLENISIKLDSKNFIITDENMKSNIDNIYAIGDITGLPMLAHKSIYEAKIASESIYNKNKFSYKTKIIPYIMYSDPEIACVGINENNAIKNNINYIISKLNWNVLGKSLIHNSSNGFTKLIFNKNNNTIIGGAIIGSNCSEMLGEISLAIEMCCTYDDISLIIHSHPTLYESIGLSASVLNKTITEILLKK